MILSDKNLFWKKKEFISFILSVLVLFIHNSSFAQYGNYSNGFVSVLNDRLSFFFEESITRFAVPMFFIFSGIAFFQGYENNKYFRKIKSRAFTLIIPYLLWNVIGMIFSIVCSYTFVSQYFVGRQIFTLTLTNVLKSIFFYGCNMPFWFVFNLIIFTLAAPIVHLIVRNKYIGFASIITLTILANFDIGIPKSIFYSQTSIIYFLIGAIIGEHYFDLASKKSTKTMRWFSIIFLFVYIVLKNIFASQTYPLENILRIIVFTLSAFSVWNITDIFIHKIKTKKLYSRSFAIYAMHVNIAAIITKLIFICLPKNGWLALPNFILTVVLTLISINLICYFLEKFTPKIYSILMGNRLKPKT